MQGGVAPCIYDRDSVWCLMETVYTICVTF